MRARRFLLGFAILVAGTLVVAGPAGADTATERVWTSYEVSATATGIVVDVALPGAPADDHLLSAEAPRSRAVVDSLGRSDANVAAVGLNDTVRSLRGIVANLVAGALPMVQAPDVPLVAESSHPTTPEAKIAEPPVVLRATSDETTSRGSAGWDGAVSSGVATATATGSRTGTLEAVASSEFNGFSAGPVAIARVVSTATVRVPVGGALQRTNDMKIEGVTVGGLALALEPGHPIVRDGVTVRYLEADETEDGVVAPGISVTVLVPESFTDEPSTVSFTLGRAAVSTRAVAAPVITPPTDAPALDLPSTAASSPIEVSGDVFLPRASDPVEVPGTSFPPAATGRRSIAPTATATASRGLAPAGQAWGVAGYLPLVLLGTAVAGAFTWFRRTGVRGTWT